MPEMETSVLVGEERIWIRVSLQTGAEVKCEKCGEAFLPFETKEILDYVIFEEPGKEITVDIQKLSQTVNDSLRRCPYCKFQQ